MNLQKRKKDAATQRAAGFRSYFTVPQYILELKLGLIWVWGQVQSVFFDFFNVCWVLFVLFCFIVSERALELEHS